MYYIWLGEPIDAEPWIKTTSHKFTCGFLTARGWKGVMSVPHPHVVQGSTVYQVFLDFIHMLQFANPWSIQKSQTERQILRNNKEFHRDIYSKVHIFEQQNRQVQTQPRNFFKIRRKRAHYLSDIKGYYKNRLITTVQCVKRVKCELDPCKERYWKTKQKEHC